jgi:hypothetical protein
MTETASAQSISWSFLPLSSTLIAIALVAIAVFGALRTHLDPFKSKSGPQSHTIYEVDSIIALAGLYGATKGGGRVGRDTGTVVRWWGFLFPVFRKTIPFDQIQRVMVSRGHRATETDAPAWRTGTNFNVSLETGGAYVVIRILKDSDAANAFARDISNMTGEATFRSS